MRFVVVVLGALALAGLVASSGPATAAKTKMGCERGKQVWDATKGQCVAKGKAAKKTAKKAGKKVAKKAPKKKK